jgi:hypothetical protein
MALSPRDKRALAIFGGIAGAAAILWLLVLRPGGEEAPEVVAPTAPSPTTETTEPPRTPPPDDGIGVIGQRDPFDPLIQPAAGGGGGPDGDGDGTDGDGTDGDGTDGDGTDGDGDGGGGEPTVSPPPPPNGEPGDESASTVGGHTVVLLGIFEQGGEPVAQVDVDGTVHIVEVGETFDDNFELMAISGDCATFLFGDQSFTLCEEAPK